MALSNPVEESIFLGFAAKRDRKPAEGTPPHLYALGNATACGDGGDPWDGLLATGGLNECDLANDVPSLQRALHHERSNGNSIWLYAYWTVPCWFDRDGNRHERLHPKIHPPLFNQPPPMDGFVPVGFDIVQIQESGVRDSCGAPVQSVGIIGCSPLFCNYRWQEFPVNHWCLIDTLDAALAAASRIAADQPEPGDYAIYHIWRGPCLNGTR